jgi:hypothetical protein
VRSSTCRSSPASSPSRSARGLERGAHLVERRLEHGQLAGALDGHALGEIAGAHAPRALHQTSDRPDDQLPREHERQRAEQQRRHERDPDRALRQGAALALDRVESHAELDHPDHPLVPRVHVAPAVRARPLVVDGRDGPEHLTAVADRHVGALADAQRQLRLAVAVARGARRGREIGHLPDLAGIGREANAP